MDNYYWTYKIWFYIINLHVLLILKICYLRAIYNIRLYLCYRIRYADQHTQLNNKTKVQ